MDVEVGIVGAGLAGLCCARRLGELGIACAVFEAAERVGGRVVTDRVDGFVLDRGFQVLLDAYPEVQRGLDLEALGVRAFAPGALVRRDGRFWRVVDPWRAPMKGLETLRAPFVTLGDGMKLAALRHLALGGDGAREPRDTAAFLEGFGFSAGLREAFFRPFFGGVTLDAELRVPAAYFLSLFGWFATGSAVLPAAGMQAVAEQLAAGSPPGTIRLGRRVTAVRANAIELEGGERATCRTVVLATDASSSARLLGRSSSPEWSGTTTLYYAAERSPVQADGEALLVLNGEAPGAAGSGPVNSLAALSDAQPSYAPAGAALLSINVLGVPAETDAELDAAVRAQLGGWYGREVEAWRLLRIDRIPHALPRSTAGAGVASQGDPEAGPLLCGDQVSTPSIQGTMESGRKLAEAIATRLR